LYYDSDADTKLIVAMVVTLDDCTSAVIDIPVNRDFGFVPVKRSSQFLRVFPAQKKKSDAADQAGSSEIHFVTLKILFEKSWISLDLFLWKALEQT
jgi:hypothetical protein